MVFATPTTGESPRVEIELEIASLAAGGEGVARAPDGRVVFVPDTAPGDRVRVELVETRSRFARGVVRALLVPGARRRVPFCDVFDACGGCSWQHVDYAEQVSAKATILRDALARIGGVAPAPAVEVEPSPDPTGWRRRARILVEGGRVGFRRRRSQALVATSRCPVLVPELDARLAELSANPPQGDGEWELLLGAEGAVRASPLDARGQHPEPLEVELGVDRLRVSPGVFVQSHGPLLPRLVESVAKAAGRGALAIELHAGAGFFTLALARGFERVVAVESGRAAVRDLRHNLRKAGLGNVRIAPERVEALLRRKGKLPSRADACVVDPPRTGLPRGTPAELARLAPARIVMLSCDAATLARDVAAFRKAGYALSEVRGFDLFPQTPHLEALVVLVPADS